MISAAETPQRKDSLQQDTEMYRMYRKRIKGKRVLYTRKALQNQDNTHLYRMYKIILIKFYVNIDINYTVFFFHFQMYPIELQIFLYIYTFPFFLGVVRIKTHIAFLTKFYTSIQFDVYRYSEYTILQRILARQVNENII